jgi:hypothetical protein
VKGSQADRGDLPFDSHEIHGGFSLRNYAKDIPLDSDNNRDQVIYTVYRDGIQTESMVIDFNFCFLHVKAPDDEASMLEQKIYYDKVYNYEVTYKTDT